MNEITRILKKIERGESGCATDLLPLVYEELRKLAQARLLGERAGHTLQATALVHEAYLRLLGPNEESTANWNGRGHFFGAAAEAMRRILIENARCKNRDKHGGNHQQITLNENLIADPASVDDLIDLNDAIEKLESLDPQKANLVKLRLFTGLSTQEAGQVLAIPRRFRPSQMELLPCLVNC